MELASPENSFEPLSTLKNEKHTNQADAGISTNNSSGAQLDNYKHSGGQETESETGIRPAAGAVKDAHEGHGPEATELRPEQHPGETVASSEHVTVEKQPVLATYSESKNDNGSAAQRGPSDLHSIQSQVQLHSDAIAQLGKKVQQVETSVCSNDEDLNQVLGNLTSATKSLAHNQSVLENKLEDLLRNQVNTDSSVNNLLEKLDQVSQFLNKAARNNTLLASAPPQQIHRGPGRPPKTRNGLASAAAALSMTSKDTLPDSSVGIPRSKRIFQDSDSATSNEESGTTAVNRTATRSMPSSAPDQELPPVKKRGPGRPPKRRNHWAEKKREALAQSASQAGAGYQGDEQPQPLGKDNGESNPGGDGETEFSTFEEPKVEEESLPATPSDDGMQAGPSSTRADELYGEQKTHRGRGRPSTKSSDKPPPLTQAQIKRQQELERRRDAREQMLVSMKYSDRNKAKLFMESNKELLRAMREEERKKRMTAFSYDSAGPASNAMVGNTPSPKPPSSSESRQHPAFLPVSQDSSAQSEHDVVMREEFRGNSSENFLESRPSSHEDGREGTPHSEATNEPTEEPMLASIAVSSSFNTPDPGVVPRKVGILSMLNEDVDDSGSSNKRQLPDIYKGGFDPEFPNKREKLDDEEKRDFRSMIPMLPEKKDNRGRPANSSSSGDNSTALLLASPVELICRNGYFYRKSDREVPITTGTYLEFKFKSKEDDLIRLTMSQEDYAELTKQDRINAYFLKPEIKEETEFASAILSKIVLTEKYVNSLEYFLMEFRWENRLVGLGLKLRESKRTWQRRKALFALFEFWRDKSREKRGFPEFTMMHAVKEMENYRIFINRSVSWFYNHITLLKMVLFELCDNIDTQWREWMFPRGQPLPVLGGSITEDNFNEAIDEVLALDFLEDGTENRDIRASSMPNLPSDSATEN
ncbi:Sum1p [Lachancea thermotolerans CBS 6340]|uniref:KLTH0F07194p n=1 Tax=Lachancea thermotolerans (strain ATCC 56472 / CBS 6340 / NRRL Y-8284) TaxID=559295 RepID=C5DKS8_LACTC|nr:KLTH0F07194p [Lachancea thermotolerans CBS 6340]CAR24079.1 KLTH0F07194p [Lachancea thermotolerans CBS 6340]